MKSILKSILGITEAIGGLTMIGGRIYAIYGDWMLGMQICLIGGIVAVTCYLILDIFD